MRYATWIAACWLFACVGEAAGQVHAYAIVNNSRDLRSVDLSTGWSTLVVSLQNNGLVCANSLCWRADRQELWTFDDCFSPSRPAGVIDRLSGRFSTRFVTNLNAPEAMTWDQATLRFYVTNNLSLYSLDPTTGFVAPRGPLGLPSGMVISALDTDAAGDLWGTTSNGHIVNVSKATGAARVIASTPLTIRAFSIDVITGEFYVAAWENQDIKLFIVDPGTGGLRFRGPIGSGEIQALEIIDGACQNGFRLYGAGCPGTGGIVPALETWGCFGSGGSIVLRVRGAMPGTIAALLFGLTEATLPMGNGCNLNLSPVFSSPIIALPVLGTGGPGNGFATLSVLVPTGATLYSFTTQGFVLDLGAPGGFANTNGLQFRVQ